MRELPQTNTSRISHSVRYRTPGSVPEPRIFQASPVGHRGRALFRRFLRRHGSTRGLANQALGDCVARGAVMVEIFAIELVQDWMQQDSLLVDCHHGVGWYRNPVVCIKNTWSVSSDMAD
jgi:hypothetical protein